MDRTHWVCRPCAGSAQPTAGPVPTASSAPVPSAVAVNLRRRLTCRWVGGHRSSGRGCLRAGRCSSRTAAASSRRVRRAPGLPGARPRLWVGVWISHAEQRIRDEPVAGPIGSPRSGAGRPDGKADGMTMTGLIGGVARASFAVALVAATVAITAPAAQAAGAVGRSAHRPLGRSGPSSTPAPTTPADPHRRRPLLLGRQHLRPDRERQPGPPVTPDRVAKKQVWASVAAGGRHTCAITTAQVLYCWGSNVSGELGIGGTAQRLEPPRWPAGGWRSPPARSTPAPSRRTAGCTAGATTGTASSASAWAGCTRHRLAWGTTRELDDDRRRPVPHLWSRGRRLVLLG